MTVEVGDALSYSVQAISAPKTCGSYEITLTHTGKLPAAAMGHNWVLVPKEAAQEVATAALKVSAEDNYVPDDDRVVAASSIVGGGESTSVTVELADLSGDYTFMCTFPGHWVTMQGTFQVI